MLAALEPGENRVTREVVHPAFKRLRYFDPDLLSAIEDRRTRVRRNDIGPKLSTGEAPAHVHHEVNRFAALPHALAGESENDVKRGNYAGLDAAFDGLVDVAEILKALVHEFHHLRRGRLNALTDLVKP